MHPDEVRVFTVGERLDLHYALSSTGYGLTLNED